MFLGIVEECFSFHFARLQPRREREGDGSGMILKVRGSEGKIHNLWGRKEGREGEKDGITRIDVIANVRRVLLEEKYTCIHHFSLSGKSFCLCRGYRIIGRRNGCIVSSWLNVMKLVVSWELCVFISVTVWLKILFEKYLRKFLWYIYVIYLEQWFCSNIESVLDISTGIARFFLWLKDAISILWMGNGTLLFGI